MIVDELKDFRTKLMQYIVYRKKQITYHEKLNKKDREDFASLYDEISISAGKYAPLIKECTGLDTIPSSAGPQDVWSWALSFSDVQLVINALDMCLQATSRTIGNLADDIEKGIRDEQGKLIRKISTVPVNPPKAFIAHGGDSPILRKLKSFLEALGVEPIVVEEQPSEGRSVAENVDWYSRQADCAVILATKGDVDSKTGGFIPRGNVLIEIGKSQEIFKDRIIYLLQAGAHFPTNVSEKVWGRFTTQCMDDAFIKVAIELHKFGLLKSVKHPKE